MGRNSDAGTSYAGKAETPSGQKSLASDILDLHRKINTTIRHKNEPFIFYNHCVVFKLLVDSVAEDVELWWTDQFKKETDSVSAMAVLKELFGVLKKGLQLVGRCAEQESAKNLFLLVFGCTGEFCEIIDDVKMYCQMMNNLIVRSLQVHDPTKLTKEQHVLEKLQDRVQLKCSMLQNRLTFSDTYEKGNSAVVEDNSALLAYLKDHPKRWLSGEKCDDSIHFMVQFLQGRVGNRESIEKCDIDMGETMKETDTFEMVKGSLWYQVPVAIKMFRLKSDFDKEYDAVMRLDPARNCSHIVQVYGHSELNGGRKALVMELMHMDLISLKKRREENNPVRPFSQEESIDIMLQIAKGMKYFHRNDVIHGQIDPSNILVEEDKVLIVKIAAFGRKACGWRIHDEKIQDVEQFLEFCSNMFPENSIKTIVEAGYKSFEEVCYRLRELKEKLLTSPPMVESYTPSGRQFDEEPYPAEQIDEEPYLVLPAEQMHKCIVQFALGAFISSVAGNDRDAIRMLLKCHLYLVYFGENEGTESWVEFHLRDIIRRVGAGLRELLGTLLEDFRISKFPDFCKEKRLTLWSATQLVEFEGWLTVSLALRITRFGSFWVRFYTSTAPTHFAELAKLAELALRPQPSDHSFHRRFILFARYLGLIKHNFDEARALYDLGNYFNSRQRFEEAQRVEKALKHLAEISSDNLCQAMADVLTGLLRGYDFGGSMKLSMNLDYHRKALQLLNRKLVLRSVLFDTNLYPVHFYLWPFSVSGSMDFYSVSADPRRVRYTVLMLWDVLSYLRFHTIDLEEAEEAHLRILNLTPVFKEVMYPPFEQMEVENFIYQVRQSFHAQGDEHEQNMAELLKMAIQHDFIIPAAHALLSLAEKAMFYHEAECKALHKHTRDSPGPSERSKMDSPGPPRMSKKLSHSEINMSFLDSIRENNKCQSHCHAICQSLLDGVLYLADLTAEGYDLERAAMLLHACHDMLMGNWDTAIQKFKQDAQKHFETADKFGLLSSRRIRYLNDNGSSIRWLQLAMLWNGVVDPMELIWWAERDRSRDLLLNLRTDLQEQNRAELSKLDNDMDDAIKDIESLVLQEPGTAFFWLTPVSQVQMLMYVLAAENSCEGVRVEAKTREFKESDPTEQYLWSLAGCTCHLMEHPIGKEREKHLQFWYEVLISPFKALFDELQIKKLVFLPQSVLSLLPFAALYEGNGKDYLIQTYAISTVPSLQMYKRCKQRKEMLMACSTAKVREALVVGNPEKNLGHAEEEANDVTSKLEGSGFIVSYLQGQSATKRAIIEKLPKMDWVHIACHGRVDTHIPFGAICLGPSDSDLLTGTELEDAIDCLQASAIVLSACSSANGLYCSEGLVGFSRSWHLLGTPSVVSSLWEVDDSCTSILMGRMYEELQSGTSISEALQYAMVSMIVEKNKQGSQKYNPSDWAAFTVSGCDTVKLPRADGSPQKEVIAYSESESESEKKEEEEQRSVSSPSREEEEEKSTEGSEEQQVRPPKKQRLSIAAKEPKKRKAAPIAIEDAPNEVPKKTQGLQN